MADKDTFYLINVISPFRVVFVPSSKDGFQGIRIHAYGLAVPLKVPSQPWEGEFD